MNLLGISGTIIGSKTAKTVNHVLEEVEKYCPEVKVELLDLRDYQLDFCDGRNSDSYTGDTKLVLDKIASANFFLIGTPIFQASMPGVLKNLVDLIPPKTLQNKVIGFLAIGGTYQHYMVIDTQLKPIASYFRAYIEPNHVYLHSDHFDSNNRIIDRDVQERLRILAEGLVNMHKKLSTNIAVY